MDNRPIGIFDSGIGGLTAAKVLEELLPHEDIIYFGDSGRNPYGGRSRAELVKLSGEDADFLADMGVKAILAACGTTSTNAMPELRRSRPDMPFFDVLDAPCLRVCDVTKSGRVAVIATEATIRTGAYERRLKELDGGLDVFSLACPEFAGMVERGHFRSGDPIAEDAVERALAPLRRYGADTLLLGCTHFPLLSDIIARVLGGITQVSAGAEAAAKLSGELAAAGLLSERSERGRHDYYTSGDPAVFAAGAEIFLGHAVEPKRHIIT